ncbi:leucine-rich repeats and immunoglobulin-like domains protein 3 [Chelonus insularis]|uniref:leucine-rich repeats and immunoglobulin-like domains protein 3 n=1 Tax=Chelonus insularis TaxID=460826 RepID=UPI00158A50BE|nr:leucine-rich repeats and immunoglobulin-like domains protein 3 [Chelonus insularis]
MERQSFCIMSVASFGASSKKFLFVKILYFIFIILWSVSSMHGLQDESGLSVTNGEENVQCPVKCACLGNVVDCSRLQLVSPPSGLPPWTETLDISWNKLEDNFTFTLPDLPQLTSLKLNRNLFSRIPDLSLFGNLTHVSISHNNIVDIDGTILQKLPYLQNLELADNKIKILKRGSFLAPNHLTRLNLNLNELTEMEPGCLDNLTLLEELRINKNGLTHIVKDIFINLTRLKVLEINRNNLHQIQGLSFTNLTNLQQLRLKRNKINTLEDGAFWPLKRLVLLQLDYNELTVVKKGGLFGLDHLRKLSLSHNRISKIESQAWELCKEIQELDLSNNRLTHIDQGSFEFLMKLEILRLDHNKISLISEGAFNSVPNLRILDLSFNKISYMIEDITTGAFNSLSKLQKLRLASNQIISINRNAFGGLEHLEELDLQGNNITSIQENAFSSMPTLSRLKMNTEALVCDCGLQWLSVWLRTNRHNDAKVRCGYPHWLKGMPLTQLRNANFTCDEFPKPRIIEEPNNQMSIKGENVTLTCRATSSADTPLNFVWKHENLELREAEIETNIIPSEHGITEASSTLYLVNISHTDAGKYQCMVSNTFGTAYSSKAKISVLIYPSFLKTPHDIKVMSGSTARLECSAEGHPSPQIAWQKDGGNDFPAARERRMHMMPTDPVLFIIDAKSADSGVYSCTAQNLAGLIVANATLTILETPTFVKPMEDRNIIVGTSVVLECMSGGSPRPQLTWKKDGQPLQVTERHFFTAEDQLLIIVDTVMDDAGSYECTMNNTLGSVSDEAILTINPNLLPIVTENNILSIVIISIVSCAVGTSIIWLIIIYQSRRRLRSKQGLNGQVPISNEAVITDGQTTQLYLDSSSQHSKDSGTGDSTNPSNDQLQLCLPEEIVTCVINNDEDTTAVSDDPLLAYTNHQRTINVENNGIS